MIVRPSRELPGAWVVEGSNGQWLASFSAELVSHEQVRSGATPERTIIEMLSFTAKLSDTLGGMGERFDREDPNER